MLLGAFLFKFIPMKIWGSDILYDASFHIITASFVLYVLWFFVDQNRNWRSSYFLLCALVLFVISVQRIKVDAHNDIGLLGGVVVSLISVGVAERRNLKGKFRF